MPNPISDPEEYGRKVIEPLHETIKTYQAISSQQTATMIRLTRAIVFLTVLLFIGLVVQIFLAVTGSAP